MNRRDLFTRLALAYALTPVVVAHATAQAKASAPPAAAPDQSGVVTINMTGGTYSRSEIEALVREIEAFNADRGKLSL